MRKRERDRQTEKEGEEAVGEIEHVQQSKVARALSLQTRREWLPLASYCINQWCDSDAQMGYVLAEKAVEGSQVSLSFRGQSVTNSKLREPSCHTGPPPCFRGITLLGFNLGFNRLLPFFDAAASGPVAVRPMVLVHKPMVAHFPTR